MARQAGSRLDSPSGHRVMGSGVCNLLRREPDSSSSSSVSRELRRVAELPPSRGRSPITIAVFCALGRTRCFNAWAPWKHRALLTYQEVIGTEGQKDFHQTLGYG